MSRITERMVLEINVTEAGLRRLMDGERLRLMEVAAVEAEVEAAIERMVVEVRARGEDEPDQGDG